MTESGAIPRGMSLSLIFGCLWVVASTVVALLPMRRQYAPGLALLLAAPLLIAWIGHAHGWPYAAAGLFAFVSLFRNPLIFLARRALGQRLEVPK